MATATIQVIDPERLSDAEAKKVPASQLARLLPDGPAEHKEVEGQRPYWQYFRCACGTVFRVVLDTDQAKYFYCACQRYMYRA